MILSWLMHVKENEELVAYGGKDRKIYIALGHEQPDGFLSFVTDVLNGEEAREDFDFENNDEVKYKKYIQYESVDYVLDITLTKSNSLC